MATHAPYNSVMETATMPKKTPGENPRPQPRRVRSAATNIRSTPEWKAWLEELAEFDRCDYVELIDRAVVEYAKKVRFEKKAPRR